MQRSNRKKFPSRNPRGGFTLVELLVVIVVITILAGMLFAGIQAARGAARRAQVSHEISQIGVGLATFKQDFHADVPSSFVLFEDRSSYFLPANQSQIRVRQSQALIRRIWPQFDFSQAPVDLNGNATTDDVIVLQGAECLVFFLGGVETLNVNDPAPTGFSENPRDPFAPGGNREGPFMELDIGRFVDVDNDGAPEYLDPIPGQVMPIQYFSSNDGRGYSAQGPDGNWGVAGTDDDGVNGVDDFGEAGWPGSDDEVIAGGCAPYYLQFTSISDNRPHNPNTYQIITPGVDGDFGIGGLYNGESIPIGQVNRTAERDNMTNFAPSTLN